jgi:hypothetical protein
VIINVVFHLLSHLEHPRTEMHLQLIDLLEEMHTQPNHQTLRGKPQRAMGSRIG